MPKRPPIFRPPATHAQCLAAAEKPKRIRGRRLQILRQRCFERSPLCVGCAERGIIRAATQRDHIIPLSQGGADIDANTQALCDDCHAEKTARDMGRLPRPRIGFNGETEP